MRLRFRRFGGEGNGDGIFTMGGGVSKAVFNGVGASGSGSCKTVASFKFGATLKGFREVAAWGSRESCYSCSTSYTSG